MDTSAATCLPFNAAGRLISGLLSYLVIGGRCPAGPAIAIAGSGRAEA